MSSSREGSQERRLNDDFQSRPPLSRRPSWRRQSAVLQKARKFEAAYLKSQEIQKYKMRNSNGSNNRFFLIQILAKNSFSVKIQTLLILVHCRGPTNPEPLNPVDQLILFHLLACIKPVLALVFLP